MIYYSELFDAHRGAITFKGLMLKIKRVLKTIFIGNTRPRQMFNLYLYFLIFGTILLMTPLATYRGQWSFLQALFTASSAFSDTGLTVKSTANDFTFFGQLIIILLIKIGGIGLITIKIFLLSLVGFGVRKSDLRERMLLQGERGSNKLGSTMGIIKVGIIVMSITEFIGAIALAFYFFFVPNSSVSYGMDGGITYYNNFFLSVWAGIFHSISAVNNAGFDIIGKTSLVPFQTDYFVQWVFIIEFVIGGIGFPVFYDLYSWIKARHHKTRFRFSLFTKLTVTTYFLVALIGVGSVLMVEVFSDTPDSIWKSEPHGEALMIIFFNTMSTRNAGFYSADLTKFHSASLIIQSFMMWIGSSPASTAGGIRTTTLAIVLISTVSLARGKSQVNAFKRQIPERRVKMAFAVAFVGAFLMFFTATVILIEAAIMNANGDITFVESLYDAASAFGTTGLSLFDNSRLGVVSQLCLIILMFVGQLGVSTTLLAWNDKKRIPNVQRLQEEVVIG